MVPNSCLPSFLTGSKPCRILTKPYIHWVESFTLTPTRSPLTMREANIFWSSCQKQWTALKWLISSAVITLLNWEWGYGDVVRFEPDKSTHPSHLIRTPWIQLLCADGFTMVPCFHHGRWSADWRWVEQCFHQWFYTSVRRWPVTSAGKNLLCSDCQSTLLPLLLFLILSSSSSSSPSSSPSSSSSSPSCPSHHRHHFRI